MRLLLCLGLAGVVGVSLGQAPTSSRRDPIRIKVRHADPYFIVAMLEGRSVVSPEMSTIFGFAGVPQQASNALNRLFEGGTLRVNPTDNSIWFFPDR